MFELAPFSKGTFELAVVVANSGALSIIGGGDTDTAIHKSRSEREDVLYFHRRRRVSGITGRKNPAWHYRAGSKGEK